MKVAMKVEDPTEVEITLTVTMPLGHWRKAVAAIRTRTFHHHAADLADKMVEALDAVDQVFEPTKPTE